MSKSNYSSQRSSSSTRHQASQRSSSSSGHQASQRSPPRSHQSHEEYSTFHIPSSNYETIFVNNDTTTKALNMLMDHVEQCKQYSIDTESERTNNQLSLIQINSIPINPPSLVMLFELKHLPDRISHKYQKISKLFQLIFRSNNEIYAWGNIEIEIRSKQEFIIWPIRAKLIDIQPHFNTWYNWARTQCRVRCLSNRNGTIDDDEVTQQRLQQLECHCHPPSPYKVNERWSLQKAFMYGCNLFIDKSYTLSHWSLSLSTSYSSLSYVDRMNMIHYATHDVMAVTFLIRPITENWSFEQIKNRKFNQMFIAFESTELRPLPVSTKTKKKIKNINLNKFSKLLAGDDTDSDPMLSDEEIYLNQIIDPNEFKMERDYINTNDNDNDDEINLLKNQNESSNDGYEIISDDELTEMIQQRKTEQVKCELNGDYEPISDDELIEIIQQRTPEDNDNEQATPTEPIQQPKQDESEPLPIKRTSNRSRRSEHAKKQRNKKHNKLKRHRYRYAMVRPAYNRFPMYMVRRILRMYHINVTHTKMDERNNNLVIGVKNKSSQYDAERKLASNMFSRRSYWYYKKLFRK